MNPTPCCQNLWSTWVDCTMPCRGRRWRDASCEMIRSFQLDTAVLSVLHIVVSVRAPQLMFWLCQKDHCARAISEDVSHRTNYHFRPQVFRKPCRPAHGIINESPQIKLYILHVLLSEPWLQYSVFDHKHGVHLLKVHIRSRSARIHEIPNKN